MKSKTFLIAFIILSLGVVAQKNYVKTGIASFYADKFEGRQTANGEIYYHAKRTAAHRTLAFGSVVKVTNLENNKYVVVRVNDRGPFVDNRIIDLSKSAAKELGFVEKGLAKVKVEVIANTEDLPDKKTDTTTENVKVYYQLNSELVNPKGKGVQIGSYTDDENVIKLIADLKKEFKQNIYVEMAPVKKRKLYRIIMGNSTNITELENLKQKLKRKFPDCFIVEFK